MAGSLGTKPTAAQAKWQWLGAPQLESESAFVLFYQRKVID